MSVIIQWVTQIIIFLLLATIVDLLIPSTATRKYIKLVIGLILLLIFLKPLFYIFDLNINEKLETSFMRVQDEQQSNHSIENLIKRQKSEIQASQDAYILEQMTVQLKEIANSELRDQYQMEISYIDFSFFNEELSYNSLEEVIVYVKDSNPEEKNISDIEEVVIDTKKPIVQGSKQDSIDEEGITSLLNQVWEMDSKTLTIKWEEAHFDR